MADKALNRKQILVFLAVTFIITYGIEIFMILPMSGSTDINEAMTAQSLSSMVMLAPAIGAILARIITHEGFLGGNLYFSIDVKRNLKYFGIVWPLFAVFIITGAILYFLIFPSRYDSNWGYAMAILNAQTDTSVTAAEVKKVMMQQVVIGILFSPFLNIIGCLGVEWGFRGYLLPKLLERFKAVPAVLIDGLIWGIWYAPLVVMGQNYGTGYPGFPVTGILAMCVFCMVTGSILSYVTIKTKSCIPAVLGHSMINGFSSIGIYFTSLENPYNVFLGPASTGLIGGICFIGFAVYLLWKLNKEEKNPLQSE
ncbi:MAG: CPBP family intramembrane metalloprotease [Lachnospiraceae bacterium]|nr:CPBP family intramembrane metalloprotease [Lachnospiraceae bacterium]